MEDVASQEAVAREIVGHQPANLCRLISGHFSGNGLRCRRVGGRAGNNRFESIRQIESNRIPVEFDLSDKTGAISSYRFVTKLALIALYYKFKQFTNIFSIINYVAFQFRINSY